MGFGVRKIIQEEKKCLVCEKCFKGYAASKYCENCKKEIEKRYCNCGSEIKLSGQYKCEKCKKLNSKNIKDNIKELRKDVDIGLYRIKKQENIMLFNSRIKHCLACGYITTPRKKKNFYLPCPKCRSKNWLVGNPYPCEICNNFCNPSVHHIDQDRKNNNPNNLLYICEKCHLKIHHLHIKNNDELIEKYRKLLRGPRA